jgi:hypothetical protein
MGVDKFVMAVLPEVLDHAGVDLGEVTEKLGVAIKDLAEMENHAPIVTSNKGNKTVH